MTTPSKLTRDAARALFANAGLTYAAVSRASLQRLRSLINNRMKASGLINGTYRCRQRGSVTVVQGTTRWAELRCQAFYFSDREAVTFGPDGFIGFAGWASDDNLEPILDGFSDWVRETAASQA